MQLNSAAPLAQLCLCAAACATGGQVSAAEVDISKLPPDAPKQIDFAQDIRPIFEANCLRCHGPAKPKSGFRLDNRDAALKGGDNGVDILPGNSTNSPLIHYVAYLVEDMQMPPVGKGEQLAPAQVSLLRAWIDQGAVWNANLVSNLFYTSLSPTLGTTVVNGDTNKFRELNWQKDGLNGGLEQFEVFQQRGPDTTWHLTGHALVDDYQVRLDVDRNDLGFVHSGWQQYRKYYDDVGGYDPLLLPEPLRLGEDLHLDIGRAWIDFGLALPNWPRVVLGYEYDYRQGNEASTEWGSVGTDPNTARNIAPASESVNEGVHIIKFDFNADMNGTTIEDRFRGEFYHLSTSGTNTALVQLPMSVDETSAYFQGANTFRLEKKFTDWFFGSAGYLYSKLNSEETFHMDEPTLFQVTSLPQLNLERESQVVNANGLIGPLSGLVFSAGVQAEWTRQQSLGNGTVTQGNPPPSILETVVPFTVDSDYNTTSLQEILSLRYSKIPCSSIYAEVHAEQENVGQDDQFSAPADILNQAVFLQHTAFSSQLTDVRTGFDTSPWRSVSFNGYLRRFENDSQYDSDPLIQPTMTAYPTFITSREILTDEAGARLVLHPCANFKTTLSYVYQASDYDVATRPYVTGGTTITSGGGLLAGQERSRTYSIGATWTPTPRLQLSGTFSYQNSTLETAATYSPAVVPYRGNSYTVLADATYVLSKTTDVFLGYFLSQANYAQTNFAAGLPLGLDYQEQSIQAGISRRFSSRLSGKLQYRYTCYDEPSLGGASNFRANSIFGTLTYQFP